MGTVEAGIYSGIHNSEDESKILLWSNELILCKISSYLSINDLKQLCCVNKYFLDWVWTLHRFSSLASQEVTGRMKIHVFKLSRAIVKVNQLDPNALRKLAPKIFQETEHLEIQGLYKLSNTQRNDLLLQIVSNCPKLTSLKLVTLRSLTDQKTCFNGSFLMEKNVKDIFVNLKELQFGPNTFNYELNPKNMAESVRSFIVPNPTYELFEKINRKMNLVRFTYTEPAILSTCYNPKLLLTNCRETLTDLKIAIDFNDLDCLNALELPKLNKLELAVFRHHGFGTQFTQFRQIESFPEHVLPFLLNHLCNLTELQFGANYCFSLAPLCDLLRQPKSTELKVLGFSSCFGFAKPLSSINWNFLKIMSNLRDFKLVYQSPFIVPDEMDDFSHFLPLLPSSIQSIEFRGFKFRGCHKDLLNTESSDLLRFKHLTALKIPCLSFLKDEVLIFICKNLTQLKILDGDFRCVTGFGGSTDFNANANNMYPGIFLANLKDLVELNIIIYRDSLPLSVDQIITLIHFPSLVKFTIQSELGDETTKRLLGEQMLRLLSQNPSLEHMHLFRFLPPWSIKPKVLKLHPRFKWQWPYSRKTFKKLLCTQ